MAKSHGFGGSGSHRKFIGQKPYPDMPFGYIAQKLMRHSGFTSLTLPVFATAADRCFGGSGYRIVRQGIPWDVNLSITKSKFNGKEQIRRTCL